MKPLIVLIVVFAIAVFVMKLIGHQYNFALAGRIAMAAMLLFTSMGHFAFAKGMAMMIPDFIPYKTAMVYLTGIIEIVAAIGLLIPAVRVLAGWLLIIFFILLLPANIQAAIKQLDFQKGTFDGSGLNYLWLRVPLQLLFIAWVYMSSIRN
jgi:uncharacterized membrane protein